MLHLLSWMIIMTWLFDHWDGPRRVIFHPKHWIKKRLLNLFGLVLFTLPRWKIGLIWDAASIHFSEMVQDKATELSITLGGITPGCTSLISIQNLISIKTIKQEFNKRYVSWNIYSNKGLGENKRMSEIHSVMAWRINRRS